MTRRRCMRNDLTVELWVNTLVDDEGLPVAAPDWLAAIAAAALPYWCVNCDRRFEGWGAALSHLRADRLRAVPGS
jgi:hypothetical protein